MCGIFGVINFDGQPVDKERVLSARDILAHRGPDDSGIYYTSINQSSNHTNIQSSVALAHRRLSIIDLSPAAHQPMTTEDGRYTIVYNGEIFNYREIINSQLKIKNLRTSSDTEVILKLYEQYGAECLNYLRGMFAFAIWDDKEKKLFAARDRFGIKPFYYLHNEKEFIFSSELKAIRRYKNGLTLSMEGIDAFLKTGSVPAPLTIYEETKALLAGQYVTIQNEKLEIKNYWSFLDMFNNTENLRGLQSDDETLTSKVSPLKYDDNAKKTIRDSLLDTVKAHMVSDVEVGAFLSGGIDSTAIVSLMRQTGHDKIKTISVTFPGNKLDESEYSNLAAKKYETDHYEYRLEEKELIDDFDNIIEAMDQPTIDGINTYFVSKAAASFGLKVVLSGLGGDELFGGYSSFINIPKYQRIKNLRFAKSVMKAASVLAKNKLPAKAIEYFNNPDTPNAEYKLMRGLFTDAELRALGWTHTYMHPYNHTAEMYEGMDVWMIDSSTPLKMTVLNDLVNVSYLESCVYMRNQLLRDSDVFSMAHSLELRVPFVDHLLYENVLPYLNDGFDKNYPKKLLVTATNDLPDEIVHRKKQGFTFPFADWIKHGQIKEQVNDTLSKNSLGLNKKELTKMISKFESGNLHWSRVWALFIASRF